MNRPELPPAAVMLQFITGRWVSGAVSAAAKLGFADRLAEGAKSAEALAEAAGTHPDATKRLLRLLVSIGIFTQREDGLFANTPLSETLRDAPGTMRAMAIMTAERPMIEAWNELEHSIRTGEPAFEKAHGAPLFDYVARDPELGHVFDAAMTSRSAMEVQQITHAFDFGSVKMLVDVAGGQGLLLATLLAKAPAQRGVLFDMPSVVAGAGPILESAGVASRCEVVGGNFFESVPTGADGYLLKHILHDWDDASCVRILRNIHGAAAPDARLFVLDAVLADGNAPSFAKILDLQMLVVTHGGRERTREEWVRLLAAGGFAITRIVDTRGPISVIEAARA